MQQCFMLLLLKNIQFATVQAFRDLLQIPTEQVSRKFGYNLFYNLYLSPLVILTLMSIFISVKESTFNCTTRHKMLIKLTEHNQPFLKYEINSVKSYLSLLQYRRLYDWASSYRGKNFKIQNVLILTINQSSRHIFRSNFFCNYYISLTSSRCKKKS